MLNNIHRLKDAASLSDPLHKSTSTMRLIVGTSGAASQLPEEGHHQREMNRTHQADMKLLGEICDKVWSFKVNHKQESFVFASTLPKTTADTTEEELEDLLKICQTAASPIHGIIPGLPSHSAQKRTAPVPLMTTHQGLVDMDVDDMDRKRQKRDQHATSSQPSSSSAGPPAAPAGSSSASGNQ